MASAECLEETKECTRLVFIAINKNSVSLLKYAISRSGYSEIQLLTSLAERNEEGETPLAIAIKRNYVSVVEEIMTFLKNVLDRNLDQLKLTFVINQLLHQFPIKELIDILIYDQCRIQNTKWLMFVAKIVIESISLTRQDKIILLELIGTALILQLNCCGITERKALCGLDYWRKAMTLRHIPTDGGDLLPKLPNFHVPSESSSFIFGSAVEVATIEELDLLQEDFLLNYLNVIQCRMRMPCATRMVIQALLVSRRFSDQEHLGHPHWFYLQSLHDFALFVWRSEDSTFKPYLFILEQLNGFDPNLLPLASFHVLILTVRELCTKFVQQLSERPNSPIGREMNYANLLIITKLITRIQYNHLHFQNVEGSQRRVLYVVYCLVFVLNSISSRTTSEEQSEEQKQLEKFYCDFIRGFPERTSTVLHEAVYYRSYTPRNAHLQTIQRLLKFGADPNAIDEDGQTPLHRLAERTYFTDMDESVPLFQVLLDAGAHLDAAGDDGKTVLCILKKKLEGKVHPYFESLINCVLPLSCYCARVIRRHGIPFEDRLPPRLKKLVSIHNAKASIDLERKEIEEQTNKKRKI